VGDTGPHLHGEGQVIVPCEIGRMTGLWQN